jgi:uncharacterized protein YbjT (DUF2867 family)
VRELSKHAEFEVRALTRNPLSEAAQKLAQLPNVTVVEAHFARPDSLLKAFTGADAVYAVTNFYDPDIRANALLEAQQGCMMADAAQQAGVELVIWSTVPSALVRTKARFASTPLVENKFTVSSYLKHIRQPHVDLFLGFYYDNFVNFGMLSVAADGAVELAQPVLRPEAKVGMIWVERDLGRTVAAILKSDRATKAKAAAAGGFGGEVYCVGGMNSPAEVAAEIQKQTGRETRVVTVPTTGLHDLDIMYECYNEYSVYSELTYPTPATVELGVQLSTLEDWVRDSAVPHVTKLLEAR